MKKKLVLMGLISLLLVGCGAENGTVTENPATEKKTEHATETSLKESYTVVFMDEDSKVIKEESVKTGTVPSCDYHKEDTDEWHYTFLGWSKSVNGPVVSLAPVTEPTVYYAVVRKEKRKYDISFFDEAGSALAVIPTEYGAIPSYSYTKADTDEWKYTFLGWSSALNGEVLNSLPAVTGPASYYALIKREKQVYTIQFDSLGGSAVASCAAEYGQAIQKPENPMREGYSFVCWCKDQALTQKVEWPYTIQGNQTFYAKWNEAVDIKGYLQAMVEATNQDPYSYIPAAMRPENTKNHVEQADVTYDFKNDFVPVSSIHYGGFGRQWNMVLDNIRQSERFYQILTGTDTVVATAVSAFNNYFDRNPDDENKEIEEEGYYAKVNFKEDVLSFTIQYKKGWDVPFFGEILPQIDMVYDVKNKTKTVRLNLTETNAIKYVISDNEYTFGIKYGVEKGSRNAYCSMKKGDDGSVTGHIYEYITLKGKDAVKSCADFYLSEDYSSVIGNKADGILGMQGYINELYKTSEGKLLGYKVQETKTIAGITGTYHTLWFNLNDISGIRSVKMTDHTEDNANAYNTYNVYVNGIETLFAPSYNTKLMVKTSRKFDIELRTQYFYGYQNTELQEYAVSTPMMFIQDNHDKYTNFDDYTPDMKSVNRIDSSVTMKKEYLAKIRSDYDTLIPQFKENKEKMDSAAILAFLGNAIGK